MSEVSLIPNGDGCGWGGNGLSAAIGGFIGSWFGNGMGGWNRGNCGNGGCGFGYPVMATPVAVGGFGGYGAGFNALESTTLAAEAMNQNSLNDIRTGITNLGMNLIQGQGRSDLTACQGFHGINTNLLTSNANQTNWVNQGFANLNQLTQRTLFDLSNTVQQSGFGLNNQIVQQGFDTRNAINNLSAQTAECCCTVRQEMAAGFAALGSKIDHNTITALQTQLCDAKAEISTLKNQQYTTASNLAQSAYLVSQLKAPATTTAAA